MRTHLQARRERMPSAMLTETMTQAYLDRINFTDPVEINHATLDKLIYQHQCCVPFETIAIHRLERPADTSTDVLFDKIVTHRMGGYCFELNKLFEELLKALGFEVRPVLSRAVRGRDGRMPINHRGILVQLDEGVYSADVGFGGPMPAGALLLAHDVEQTIAGELFTPRKADHAWWKIERITRAARDFYDDGLPERRQVELELCTAAVEEIDFAALNLFFSQPGTLFRDHEVVNLRTPNGYLGLKDFTLTKKDGTSKEVIELPDRAAVNDALINVFGMTGLYEWFDKQPA